MKKVREREREREREIKKQKNKLIAEHNYNTDRVREQKKVLTFNQSS